VLAPNPGPLCPTKPAGGPLFSLPGVLARVPPHVPAVRFMDFEGQPEAGGITNRYEQAGGAWGEVGGGLECLSTSKLCVQCGGATKALAVVDVTVYL
jgi:hypothetical protein